jgi:hypothetical protein
VENIKGTAKRPREDELAVASDGSIGCDAVRALKDPIGDVLSTLWPKEAETDAMQSFVNAHMAGGRGGMVSRKDVPTE